MLISRVLGAPGALKRVINDLIMFSASRVIHLLSKTISIPFQGMKLIPMLSGTPDTSKRATDVIVRPTLRRINKMNCQNVRWG